MTGSTSAPALPALASAQRGVAPYRRMLTERRADLIEQLTRQSILMESVGAKLDASMASAMDMTPGLKAQLEESATASSDAVIDAQGEIVKLTGRASGQSTTPDAYFSALSRGIDAINGLEGRLGASLQSLLTARVASLRQSSSLA